MLSCLLFGAVPQPMQSTVLQSEAGRAWGQTPARVPGPRVRLRRTRSDVRSLLSCWQHLGCASGRRTASFPMTQFASSPLHPAAPHCQVTSAGLSQGASRASAECHCNYTASASSPASLAPALLHQLPAKEPERAAVSLL